MGLFYGPFDIKRDLIDLVFGNAAIAGGRLNGIVLFHTLLHIMEHVIVHAEILPKAGLCGGCATLYDQHVFAARLGRLVMRDRLAKRGAQDLLVALGQLTAKRDAATLSQRGGEVGECGAQLVWCFVKDHRAALGAQARHLLAALGLDDRQEALEAKACGRKPRQRQCVNGGTAAGDTRNGNPLGGAQRDQILAGVRDGGRTCVGDEGTAFAPLESLDNVRASLSLVVLVVRDERLGDAEIMQQLQRVACVLGGDKVNAR